ncbi:reverse transcriptase (RNA-dependent DNA polymerase) domain-containing protein [Phthorimaea operculella]|nr:reverse transcriptase (RNA-dependent DNA polymerase) domain-containing protein [Phthorimaea operculella]
MALYLSPRQLGFGTQLGCEAAIHAVRAFAMDPANADCVILKFDIRNAFNSLERYVLLKEVSEKIPSLYPFLFQLYSSPSNLFYGQTPIPSQVGVQQGDPLGPLIFSLGIHKVIESLQSPLNVWYLDDGTIGGKPDVLQRDLQILMPSLMELGLEVNTFPHFEELVPGLKELDTNSFYPLGSPIFPSSIPDAFSQRQRLLRVAQERLQNLSAHVAITLLRVCFAVPKLMYLLRTCPTWLYPDTLAAFDGVLKDCVETILNVSLSETQWDQASLPVRHGGLGERPAGDVGLPAFLASVHGVAGLVTTILPNGDGVRIPNGSDALEAWLALNSGEPLPARPDCQRLWDEFMKLNLPCDAGITPHSRGCRRKRLRNFRVDVY